VRIIFDRNTALPVAITSCENDWKGLTKSLERRSFKVNDDTGGWMLGLHHDSEKNDDGNANGRKNDEGAGGTSLDALNQYGSTSTSPRSPNSDNDADGSTTNSRKAGGGMQVDLEGCLEQMAHMTSGEDSDDMIFEELTKEQLAQEDRDKEETAASLTIDVSGGGE
jgi:hypothetical protein